MFSVDFCKKWPEPAQYGALPFTGAQVFAEGIKWHVAFTQVT